MVWYGMDKTKPPSWIVLIYFVCPRHHARTGFCYGMGITGKGPLYALCHAALFYEFSAKHCNPTPVYACNNMRPCGKHAYMVQIASISVIHVHHLSKIYCSSRQFVLDHLNDTCTNLFEKILYKALLLIEVTKCQKHARWNA